MTILIKQFQSEMKESIAFSRRAEIVGINISSAAFSVPNALPLEFEKALSVGIKIEPKDALVSDDCVRATTLFECLITESAESQKVEPLAKFECALTATYHLQDGYIPTESELAAFHKANVVFNCWPYFREFIQSAACRMNIPSPPIPFVRVQVVPNESRPAISELARKRATKALKS
jgi:hypothetical protein